MSEIVKVVIIGCGRIGNVSFQNELNSFIHSIKNKTKPKVSLFDGKQATILAEAAYS